MFVIFQDKLDSHKIAHASLAVIICKASSKHLNCAQLKEFVERGLVSACVAGLNLATMI